MTKTRTNFYVTGGTLEGDALSYVHRQADGDLYAGLTAGEFCYVLTPRQMGKSSLMVRTAARLREEGVAVAQLDLTKVGRNLTVKQWYFGLLERVGIQLGMEDELEEFWRAHEGLGPLQRLTHSLQEVVLKRIEGRLVIFVDEIDYVRSLPFSADEFFAAIREFYNSRTAEPELRRLTVCLLGVATPSDLISDARTTPFNIGRRIELTDFSEEDAAPLARGLGRDGRSGTRLLKRVLHWTGGHPYLTQRLCLAVAEGAGVDGEGDVDRVCSELFLSAGARDRDDNLLFVRESLLRREVAERVALLDLYQKIRGGTSVPDDVTNRLVTALRLSGVTRAVGGALRVRNRIYRRTFDDEWVMSHMPDDEARRQRAAFRKGVRRTSLIAAAVLVVMTVLTLFAYVKSREAAEASERSRRLLYVSQMPIAQQLWETGNVSGLKALLETQAPVQGEQDDLRSFEWFYMWRLAQSHPMLEGNNGEISHLAFSPDGGRIVTASEDGTAAMWDVATKEVLFKLVDNEYDQYLQQKAHQGEITSVSFSPDGKWIITSGEDDEAKVWDAGTGERLLKLEGHTDIVNCSALSSGARRAVTGSDDRTAKVWDARTGKLLHTLAGHRDSVTAVAISPDGRRVATGSFDKAARIWDADSGRLLHTLRGHTYKVFNLDFSPDGKSLVTATYEDSAKVWDVESGRNKLTLEGHEDIVVNVGYTPDGKHIVTGSNDNTAKVWDAETGEELFTFSRTGLAVESAFPKPDGGYVAVGFRGKSIELWDPLAGRESLTLKGHEGPVYSVDISPDGRRIATASIDGTAKIWDAATGDEIHTLMGHTDGVTAAAFSPDGKYLATGSSDSTAIIWNAETGELVHTLTGHEGWVAGVAFSPDGKYVVTGSADKTARIWEVATGTVVQQLKGYSDTVTSVVYSPDGRRILTSNLNKTAQLWDTATGRETLTFKAHTGNVNSIVISPDGRRIVTGSDDRTARVWDLDVPGR